ncbi:MAG: tRNA (adenosine(37)-N6)-threonylcarbamoyltransferase complex dimerization subunit type 1 TsaB [Caldimicrobium sp.]
METSLKSKPLILGIETSGKTGGLALFQEKLLYEINFQAKESYSKTFFQFLPFLLEKGEISFEDVQIIAVDLGPGSFTGLRIGISAIKALSLVYPYSILPLSSLELLAYNFWGIDLPILSLVDAYTKEVFLALYKFEGEDLKILIPPKLVKIEEVKNYINEPTLFVSESLEKWEDYFAQKIKTYFIKPPIRPMLRASLLCEVAWLKIKKGEVNFITGDGLFPLYLKASEAERQKCLFSS